MNYAPLLAEIKTRVQSARIKAGLAADRELLALYWNIGRLILDRQKAQGWGAKIIDRLSGDLQKEFPGQQGFSPRNLKYMRAFAEAWPEAALVPPPVLPPAKIKGKFAQQAVAQVAQGRRAQCGTTRKGADSSANSGASRHRARLETGQALSGAGVPACGLWRRPAASRSTNQHAPGWCGNPEPGTAALRG